MMLWEIASIIRKACDEKADVRLRFRESSSDAADLIECRGRVTMFANATVEFQVAGKQSIHIPLHEIKHAEIVGANGKE